MKSLFWSPTQWSFQLCHHCGRHSALRQTYTNSPWLSCTTKLTDQVSCCASFEMTWQHLESSSIFYWDDQLQRVFQQSNAAILDKTTESNANYRTPTVDAKMFPLNSYFKDSDPFTYNESNLWLLRTQWCRNPEHKLIWMKKDFRAVTRAQVGNTPWQSEWWQSTNHSKKDQRPLPGHYLMIVSCLRCTRILLIQRWTQQSDLSGSIQQRDSHPITTKSTNLRHSAISLPRSLLKNFQSII